MDGGIMDGPIWNIFARQEGGKVGVVLSVREILPHS